MEVSDYWNSKGIDSTDEINNTQDHFEEIIQKLLEKTRLSHRKIARLLGVNNNIVHKTNLKKK